MIAKVYPKVRLFWFPLLFWPSSIFRMINAIHQARTVITLLSSLIRLAWPNNDIRPNLSKAISSGLSFPLTNTECEAKTIIAYTIANGIIPLESNSPLRICHQHEGNCYEAPFTSQVPSSLPNNEQ